MHIGGQLTRQFAPHKPQHLVSRRIRVLATVPLIHLISLSALRRTPTISIPFLVIRIDIEHAVELSEHQTEHPSGDAQRRAEDDPHIPHRHLVDRGILDDQDEVGC